MARVWVSKYLIERVQKYVIMSYAHGVTHDLKEMQPLEYVSTRKKGTVSKDHKIRTGIEPSSSDIRSVILPLRGPDFLPCQQQRTHVNPTYKECFPTQ
jgi:hypothetical protein